MEKFNLRNQNLNEFLRQVLEARCKAAAILTEIGKEKARRRDIWALSMSPFLSLLHEDVPVSLKGMGTKQLRQVLCGEIAMTLYCQDDLRVYHVFCRVFKDNQVSIVYVSKAGYVQKKLETRLSKSLMAHALSQPSGFRT